MSNQSDAAKVRMAGESDTLLEMYMEAKDPAKWAAMQLCKPDQPPAQTIGEVMDRVEVIFQKALAMALAQKPRRTRGKGGRG